MHTLRIFQTKSNYLLFGVNLVRLQESANVCSTFKLAFSKVKMIIKLAFAKDFTFFLLIHHNCECSALKNLLSFMSV